jgi:hypothetical protein
VEHTEIDAAESATIQVDNGKPTRLSTARDTVNPDKTHHAAFDRELFTIDQECRIRVHPSFKT